MLPSLAFSGPAFHFDRHHRLIVEGLHTSRMPGHCLEDRVHDAVGGLRFASRHQFFHSCAPEQVARLVAGIEYAIAEEYEYVSRLGMKGELVIVRLVKQAQRQSGRLDDLDLAVMTVNRAGKSGIGYGQGA